MSHIYRLIPNVISVYSIFRKPEYRVLLDSDVIKHTGSNGGCLC